MNILNEAKRVLRIEAEAIKDLIGKLNSDFEKAVELIHQAKGRVVVTGMGKSGLVGRKIAATLASTGTPAFFLHPAEAGHGDLGMVTKDEVAIAISNSGETEEVVGLLPYLKRFDVKIISMSGNPNSTLAKSSDVNINIAVKEEACPMGIVPTASTTAALAMGDAIAVSVLIKRGLKEEDFASFHPQGNLGKRLLIKVSDLMHRGDEIPKVKSRTSMLNAVVEMSSKRLGLTIVVDEKDIVLGIITDGDLRRGIEKWGERLFRRKAEEVMTRNPKSVTKDALAAKALSIMESYSITSLLVPNKEGRAEGVIHLHDILKKGIV